MTAILLNIEAKNVLVDDPAIIDRLTRGLSCPVAFGGIIQPQAVCEGKELSLTTVSDEPLTARVGASRSQLTPHTARRIPVDPDAAVSRRTTRRAVVNGFPPRPSASTDPSPSAGEVPPPSAGAAPLDRDAMP